MKGNPKLLFKDDTIKTFLRLIRLVWFLAENKNVFCKRDKKPQAFSRRVKYVFYRKLTNGSKSLQTKRIAETVIREKNGK